MALVSTAGVLALTHIPQDALPNVLQYHFFDKIEHVVAYGAVAFFFLRSLKRPVQVFVPLAVLLALAVTGALDEVTQPLVNRHASIVDYAADLVGIAVAYAIFLVRGRFGDTRVKVQNAK